MATVINDTFTQRGRPSRSRGTPVWPPVSGWRDGSAMCLSFAVACPGCACISGAPPHLADMPAGLDVHEGRSYGCRPGRETPCVGNFTVLIAWRRITPQGDARPGPWLYPRTMSMSTLTAHRLFAARPSTRTVLDVAIAAAALVGSLSQLSHGASFPNPAGAGELDLVSVVLVTCSTVPLIVWRRSPLAVFAMTAAASVLLAGLGYRITLLLGPTAALYLLAASREEQTPWRPRTTLIVGGLMVAFLGATASAQGAFPGGELLHTGLAWAVAWFAGERTRLRREHIAELSERALRAEREAERERLLAAAEERARIARDLHDSAGHATSVIAVRAGAARLRHHQDPDRSLAALEAIEELARQTAQEIDQIVGTLREGGPRIGAEAPPGLASLDTLIAHHRAAGREITLDTAGAPRPLGAVADQGAYRILQEALTNATRHGTGSARVELAFGDEALELEVTNPVPAGSSPRFRGGHGLVGMRERATLLGGNLDVERSNGAFRVRARIPYGGQRA
jgi:signal transduction histidine kinase